MRYRSVGLSQRVEVIESYGERRDCLDQMWARLLWHNGLVPIPLPNLSEGAIDDCLHHLQLDGVILTGGNDLATAPGATNVALERDLFEHRLIAHCLERNVPLLGVCRGAQMLNHYFGGQLERVEGHVAKRHTLALASESVAWLAPYTARWPAELEVNSFHGFAPTLASEGPLVAIASTSDGAVEAFAHKTAPCLGIMWHPERENEATWSSLDFVGQFFNQRL